MATAIERHGDRSSEEKKIDNPPILAEERIQHIHTINNLPDPDAGLSEDERAVQDKELLRKLDFKLIPWLSFLYRMCHSFRLSKSDRKLTTVKQ